MLRLFTAILVLALLAGCDRASPPEPAVAAKQAPAQEPPEAGPGYELVANSKQVMLWILDPAADVLWDNAGTIITAEGRAELAPTTDEGWDKVRDHGAIVVEAGNLLMMPGRSRGPDWNGHVRDMQSAAKKAIAAAEARDAEALFDAGGEVYVVCRSCHEQFWVPFEELRPGL
jgi:hypothetical protein